MLKTKYKNLGIGMKSTKFLKKIKKEDSHAW